MKSVTKYGNECIKEIEDAGIKHGEIWSFLVDYKTVNQWGYCRKLSNGYYNVYISKYLLYDDSDEKALKETILHEILHTCRGCFNHGKTWKKHADKLNKLYGYSITCTAVDKDKNLCENALKDRRDKYKYLFQCESCGNIVGRMRKSDFTENPYDYHCAFCGGKIKQIK